MFLLPPVVSVVSLVVLWRGRHLRRPWAAAGFCAAGLALQGLCPMYSPAWATGLVLNVATAFTFVTLIKLRW